MVTSNLPRAQGLAAQLFCKRNWLQNQKQLTPPWCIWPQSASFADLPPAGLIWVLNNSSLRHASAGECAVREPSSNVKS